VKEEPERIIGWMDVLFVQDGQGVGERLRRCLPHQIKNRQESLRVIKVISVEQVQDLLIHLSQNPGIRECTRLAMKGLDVMGYVHRVLLFPS
jgi:hypothetical protein